MRSSVSWVASTAPWPARAWSEWPCVITALSTGRVGSIWKPPILQYTPAGVGKRISSGRIGLRYGVIGAMTDGPLPPLFAGPAVICWSGRQYSSASNPALSQQGNNDEACLIRRHRGCRSLADEPSQRAGQTGNAEGAAGCRRQIGNLLSAALDHRAARLFPGRWPRGRNR